MANDQARAQATKVSEDVSKLMQSMRRLLAHCYDALGPDATPAQRAQLRKALKSYVEATDDGMEKSKPGD